MENKEQVENKKLIEESAVDEGKQEEVSQKKSLIKTIVKQAENYVKAKKDAEEKMKSLKQGAEDALSGVCFSLIAMHLSQVLFAQVAPVVAIAAASVPLIYLYGKKQKQIKRQNATQKSQQAAKQTVCSL